jgi:hypothetical protein
MGYDPIPDAVTPEAVRERDRYVADIRAIFPRARWPEIDFMLWNMTAWPICGNSEAIRQLSEIRAECGSDAKRGWWRKVGRMANRIDRECYQAGLDHAKAKRATAPSASAAQESSS